MSEEPSTQGQPLVRLLGVSKTYSGIPVLRGAELVVNAGEVHALIGENGAGKSTLMKILAGAERPDAGAQLEYFGERYDEMTPSRSLELGVNVMYQDLSLFPNLSVAENVCFVKSRGSRRFRKSQVRRSAKQVLDSLGLSYDIDEPVETLSFGRRQLLALARAVASDARLIVMDEPTSALSSSEVAIFYRIVDQLRRRNVGIVFISHKFEEIFQLADSVSVLRDGKTVTSGPIADYTEDALITAMVGRETEYEASRITSAPGDEVLRVEGLALDGMIDDVSFVAHQGEVVAITGLVGSGRTELAHVIFGVTPSSKGRILIAGDEVRVRTPAQAMAHGIGYVPEDRRHQGIFAGHSIAVNISIARLRAVVNRLSQIVAKRELALSDSYIERLDIRPPSSSADAGTLSGGNQQKVLLSRWMNAQPKVLIVDEPTNGIDIGAKREIHRLLQDLARNGAAVVVISSELPEVFAIANRILVMRGGRIVAETTPELSTPEEILEIELQS